MVSWFSVSLYTVGSSMVCSPPASIPTTSITCGISIPSVVAASLMTSFTSLGVMPEINRPTSVAAKLTICPRCTSTAERTGRSMVWKSASSGLFLYVRTNFNVEALYVLAGTTNISEVISPSLSGKPLSPKEKVISFEASSPSMVSTLYPSLSSEREPFPARLSWEETSLTE